MKKTIILAMLLAVCSLGNAQAYKSPLNRSAVTMILDSLNVAYAAGDMVRDLTPNRLTMFTEISQRNANNFTGYFTYLKVTVDSVCNSSFTLYALKDTTGLGATLTVNNAAAQMRDNMSAQIIGFKTVSVSSLGTYAGGARKSMGEAQWFHPYDLTSYGTKIWWIVVVNDAWTPAQRCNFRIEAFTEAY